MHAPDRIIVQDESLSRRETYVFLLAMKIRILSLFTIEITRTQMVFGQLLTEDHIKYEIIISALQMHE